MKSSILGDWGGGGRGGASGVERQLSRIEYLTGKIITDTKYQPTNLALVKTLREIN